MDECCGKKTPGLNEMVCCIAQRLGLGLQLRDQGDHSRIIIGALSGKECAELSLFSLNIEVHRTVPIAVEIVLSHFSLFVC